MQIAAFLLDIRKAEHKELVSAFTEIYRPDSEAFVGEDVVAPLGKEWADDLSAIYDCPIDDLAVIAVCAEDLNKFDFSGSLARLDDVLVG